MKKRYIALVFLAIVVIVGITTPLLSNTWGVLTDKGYRIPKESSIFTFEATKMNEGSGDYWLYGEDNQYYYSLALKDLVSGEPYIKISKQDAKEISYFDKHKFYTWKSAFDFLCGDLLTRYGEKPEKLEFISCESVDEPQKIIRLMYRVRGEDSKEVEDFLVEKYGMTKLKWACCAWNGRGGQFNHDKFKAIHPYLGGGISMYASGEVEGGLEIDPEKIEYFYVEITLSIV